MSTLGAHYRDVQALPLVLSDNDRVDLAALLEATICAELGVRRRLPSPHGTRSRYNAGCHCADCTRANREYLTAWRRARGVRAIGSF